MNKQTCILGATLLALAVFPTSAQQVLTHQLSGNGELQWNDVSSVFVKAKSYTIEWASSLGTTQSVWSPFSVIPATNAAYTVEVPMFYRLRAEVEGSFPNLKIALLSDLHYFEPSLLVQDGVAFQTYLAADRKLLKESQAILDEMVVELKQADPDIVVVSGDLTKDGERLCHQSVIARLRQLQTGGAQVYVIPGNHDINNPHALSYDGDKVTPVPSVSADEFVSLYADFGYSKALARDPNSRSYVAEPVPGLWILAMDACHPERNTNSEPFVGGYFDAPRLQWITSQLSAARAQGKYVVGLMHPGLLEHYSGQKNLFPEYVVDDNQAIAQLLASYGVRVVFTGHYHAQDIVQGNFNRGAIYDIETGSAVTYPCPYRILNLSANGELAITSHAITNINYDLGGAPFPTYASNYLYSGLTGISTYMLLSPPYNLTQANAEFLAPALTEAFVSHYQGDEDTRPISASTKGIIAYLQGQGDPLSQMMANILLSVFTDPAPADNSLTINLITGNAQ